jgi:hypothetical protein
VRTGIYLLLFALSAGASSAGQLPGPSQAAPRTALVVGQVIDAGTGSPVGGALVDISVPAAPLVRADPFDFRLTPALPVLFPRIMTGADGRFVFRRLPKGSFIITAVKPGYLEGAYGRRRPGGASQTLVVVDGQKIGGLRVYLFRHAAISGMVIDEAGEPAVGIQIRALLRTTVAGRRRFVYAGQPGWTDDRGIYRIHGLLPGDYIVAAVATQVSVAASTARDVRQSGVSTASIAEIGAATASGGPTSMEVGDAVLTLGKSAIGPAPTRDGRLFVYPTTFHPNTPNPLRATAFAVGSGEERPGIDLHITPVATRRVSGVLISPDGQIAGIPIRMVAEDAEDAPLELEVATTMTNRLGTFVFPAVPVGLYSVRVVKGSTAGRGAAGAATTIIHTGSGATLSSGDSPGARMQLDPFQPSAHWANVPLAVGKDNIANLSITLQTGARVTGRIEFEGLSPKPTGARLSQIPVVVEPATNTSRLPSGTGRFDGTGQFQAFGLPGGRYLVRVGATPPGWYWKSVTFNGRDVLETPLNLETDAIGVVFTLTDRLTEMAGTVRNAAGISDTGATVIVFPSDPHTWSSAWVNPRQFRSARVEPTGAFKISPLPAGDYYVAAVPDEVSRDWQEPAFLEALSRVAARVKIADGDKKTQDLRVREFP